jgi:hypothetical protein
VSAATHDGESLGLRAGELVEVLSEEEILRTLDARGTLDSLPFMPEMLAFCGTRFRVHRRAHKACDTVTWGTMRRMESAVHLEGVRCDGSAHGGCQAGCLIYWKEAWLRRAGDSRTDTGAGAASTSVSASGDPSGAERPSRDALLAAARTQSAGEDVFFCQATEVVHASTAELPWWKLAQYVEDVRSGNASARRVSRSIVVGLVNKLQKIASHVLPRRMAVHGGKTYPFVLGKLHGATPSIRLDLQPGELVEVKSREEIFETLNESDSTRGLRFDSEMLQYCGRRGRVLRRVERAIDEGSGKMLSIGTDCIIIDEFVCTGDYHRSCPRSVYTWWREAWLKRVEQP